MSKYFITTTLPYANSTPHVGHCLEFIQGDAIARFLRQIRNNNEVSFNIGLDEHGLKIYQAAQLEKIDPKEFVDRISAKWSSFCDIFDISYDTFYRTSDKKHHEKVQAYWQILVDKGDIYKKPYHGKYCVGCEEFKTETQLVNNKCETHPSLELQNIEEENWFLKLTNYRDQILKYVQENDKFLKPYTKKNELINLIKDVEDLSVSRRRDLLPWGVQAPNDPDQTIYVWFEALLNYIFACGTDAWNNHTTTIQLCGPDNLKFQALIWQGILLANNNHHTDHLLVHGTILDKDGQKMSKSIGNVIDPVAEVEKYGINAVRYYILKGLQTYSNSNWSSKDLVELYNADLANNFGNLLARTLHLIDTNKVIVSLDKAEQYFVAEVGLRVESIASSWSDFEISYALEKTQALVSFGNKYINDQKPWSNPEVLDVTLNNLYYLLHYATELYEPVIPEATEKIRFALFAKQKAIIFNRIK